MTYRQPATCRKGGCGRLASAEPAGDEGDLGWCDEHRASNRSLRGGGSRDAGDSCAARAAGAKATVVMTVFQRRGQGSVMMTEDEFKAFFAGPDLTWNDLARWLDVEPCDCGESFCHGWSTRARKRIAPERSLEANPFAIAANGPESVNNGRDTDPAEGSVSE